MMNLAEWAITGMILSTLVHYDEYARDREAYVRNLHPDIDDELVDGIIQRVETLKYLQA